MRVEWSPCRCRSPGAVGIRRNAADAADFSSVAVLAARRNGRNGLKRRGQAYPSLLVRHCAHWWRFSSTGQRTKIDGFQMAEIGQVTLYGHDGFQGFIHRRQTMDDHFRMENPV